MTFQNSAPDTVKWIIAGLSAFIVQIPELTQFLLILMVIDIFFALGVAVKRRTLSYSEMYDEATRKVGSLAFIVLGAVMDRYVNPFDINLAQAITFFYIGPQLINIVKKAIIVGVPVPPQVASVMKYFSNQETPSNATSNSKKAE